MKRKTIGFLGLGSMGFPICHGLAKSGYQVIIPTYRKDEDSASGYSPLVPDREAKLAAMDELVSSGAIPASNMRELVEGSDIILISMPTSRQVECLVLSSEGILQNAKPGTVVIDLTTADPSSTRKLAAQLEEKGIDLLDAPVSGGTRGAIAQTLTVMVGGKEAVFQKYRPILDTLGCPEKVFYLGESGTGNTIKVVNNCMMACNVLTTTEALSVATKAGVDPHRALDVINASGGRSLVSMDRFPTVIFPGKPFNFSLSMMRKDVGLFSQIAKDMRVPVPVTSAVNQVWNIPTANENDDMQDMIQLVKMYERWMDVELVGIDT